jgi:glycosyltransferase involved in cell wall biosynthesis
MFSRFVYQRAHQVTSLYQDASRIQQELGCPPEKCEVIGNGLDYRPFSKIPRKKPSEWIDIAAVVRFAPIKDIKTMIYTFSRLKQQINNVRLHILGGVEDEEYYQECLSLIEFIEVQDIIIPGTVDVVTYLENIDFTLLTSISEGQPFAILESFASRRPVVSTDVGSCRELIEGREDDPYGSAGICVPPMHQSALLNALIDMCLNGDERLKMGEAGQKRVENYYDYDFMIDNYLKAYDKAILKWQESDSN